MEKENVILREKTIIEKSYIEASTTKFNKIQDEVCVYRTNGDSILLKEIINDRTLVFAYNKISCGVCVSNEMQILNKYFENNVDSNILILGNSDDFRHLISFQKVNNLKVPIYWIGDNLPLLISGIDTELIYFTINKTLTISNIFVPIKENGKLTQSYLNNVFD